ncbi:acetylxylan esterase [Lentisphaera marina]|uniref:alpha/beta hydrolase family protein n=1 Tax=Lentisphaera marina TaxID=1111041 RepID=UPI0023650814|nr:acetylxylan esterase [Lentisphaera marina]MDD7983985.1 acetylxylan esterase [Lentisphaera marina]
MKKLFSKPQWSETDLAAAKGMKSIIYQSIPYKQKPVDVFAYYSAPNGPIPEGGWPAVVCVHGGGGTAFPTWVQKWNDAGYAAISMDLEGHIPLNRPDKKGRQSTPNPGPSRVGVFHDFDKELKEQWYYHAMAQIMIGHSLIRSFPEVNPEQTGLTGISWGGNLTSSVMGVDTRFKFAIPGYGCGFLPSSSGHQGRAINDGKHSDVVNQYYDGSAYFKNVNYPTLWVNGTNDFHFDMPAFQASANAVKGQLRFELEMGHGHGPVWNLPECYAFADSVIKNKPGLITFEKPQADANQASVKFAAPAKIASVELLYTLDPNKTWPEKKWFATPAKIIKNELQAELPPGTQAFLFTAKDSRGLMSSSRYLEHQVAGLAQVNESTELNFADLYSAAISPAPSKRIFLADNFENGISSAIEKSFKIDDPKGVAGIQEWYDQKASGGKSLKVKNSASVQHAFMPSLNQWFRGPATIKNGSIILNCALLIPSSNGNALSIHARDYTTTPQTQLLSLAITSSTITCAKQTLNIRPDQWLHLELTIPVNQSKKAILLKVRQKDHDPQKIEIKSNPINTLSWLGLMLGGKKTGELFLDNIVISHLEEDSQ